MTRLRSAGLRFAVGHMGEASISGLDKGAGKVRTGDGPDLAAYLVRRIAGPEGHPAPEFGPGPGRAPPTISGEPHFARRRDLAQYCAVKDQRVVACPQGQRLVVVRGEHGKPHHPDDGALIQLLRHHVRRDTELPVAFEQGVLTHPTPGHSSGAGWTCRSPPTPSRASRPATWQEPAQT